MFNNNSRNFCVLLLGFLLAQTFQLSQSFPEAQSGLFLPDADEVDVDHVDVDAEAERNIVERDADYQITDYTDNCGLTHNLAERKSIKFVSPFYGMSKPYPPGTSCKWYFIGDTLCIPELTCKTFELKPPEDDDCGEEYLEVSDGVGGSEKWCGKKTFDAPIGASNGARDLYVTLQTGNGKSKGFSCEVSCASAKKKIGQGSAKKLAAAEDARKEEFGCVCGLRNQDDRIVGGQDVSTMTEFPWQAAVVFKGTRQPKCGASVINDRYILTAAHCFVLDSTEAKDVEVLIHAQVLDASLLTGNKDVELGKAGSIRAPGYKEKKKTDKDEKTQRFKVVEVISHPLFTDTYDYDVALLKLDRKISLVSPDAPTPICLPAIGDYGTSYEGKTSWVVGWGLAHEQAGGSTRMLQKLDVPVLKLDTCRQWVPYELTQRMLCAGYENGIKDACTGDSGGPLIYQKPNKQWEQIGIVSWGEGCARKKRPGMYSRVTELRQWIQFHAQGATWCRDTKAVQD